MITNVNEKNYNEYLNGYISNIYDNSDLFYQSLFYCITLNNIDLFKKTVFETMFNLNHNDYSMVRLIIKNNKYEMLNILFENYRLTVDFGNIILNLTSFVIESHNLNMLKTIYENNYLNYKFSLFGSDRVLNKVFIKDYDKELSEYIMKSNHFKIDFDKKCEILKSLLNQNSNQNAINLFVNDKSFYPYLEHQNKDLYLQSQLFLKIEEF